MSSASAPLVEVDRVTKRFRLRGRTHNVTAVNGVSMAVERGEAVAIVGESGSGKTTLGELVLGLTRPSAGTVRFDGLDLGALSKVELRRLRRRMQIVFQDPYASLNPYLRIGDAIIEPLLIHRIGATRQEREAMLARLLAAVGLAAEHARRYPHEFSGGQRQRIGIARALAVQPDLIVADEPVSALDVSIQAQIVNLFQDLRADYRLTIIVISHDLAVVAHLADRVYVIYLGVVMEHGRSDDVFADPRHPYTAALLSAVPTLDFALPRQRIVLQGDVPSPLEPPSGCVFRTRCPFALDVCAERVPSLREVSAGHWKACLRDDLGPLVNRDPSVADLDVTSERSVL